MYLDLGQQFLLDGNIDRQAGEANRSKRIDKAGRRSDQQRNVVCDKGDDLFEIQAGINQRVMLEVNLTSRLEEAKLTECGKVIAVTAGLFHLCLILLGHVVKEGA